MYVFRQKNHLGGEGALARLVARRVGKLPLKGSTPASRKKNLLARPMSKAQLGSGSGNGPQLWTGLLTSNGPLYTGGVGVQRFSRHV